MNAALSQLDCKEYGSESRDYLLFDGLTAAMFYADLGKALKNLKLRHRSPHKTRHTFFTWFYGQTHEDMFLSNWVGGHRDSRDVEGYCHLRELIGREREQQKMKNKRMKKVE